MKCTYCGAEIPEGMLYCGKCGTEVQMVPDYNPLDDVLAKQVRGSIGGSAAPENGYRTRGNTGRVRPDHKSAMASSPKEEQRRTSDTRSKRRHQRERKKQLARKKRQRRMMILGFFLAVLCLLGFLIYQNSYTGIVRKGNRALVSHDYDTAKPYFEKALKKNNVRLEAYAGLAKVYTAEEDLDTAESLFLDAIASQTTNTKLYEGVIQFYTDTDQLPKITTLMADCEEESVLLDLSDYQSAEPDFSLEEGTYEDVQQVSLSSSGEAIYYTTDGTDPTISSTKYTEAILLNEGTTEIKAISVNKKGIPSVVADQEYIIELPVADAPAVSPSTGQYDAATKISIFIPTGYEAYYTLDGSEPTSASIKYLNPIDMPEGSTIFCAVLVNTSSGKTTAVTKRNYVLEYE